MAGRIIAWGGGQNKRSVAQVGEKRQHPSLRVINSETGPRRGVPRAEGYETFRFDSRDSPNLSRDTLMKRVGAEALPDEELVAGYPRETA